MNPARAGLLPLLVGSLLAVPLVGTAGCLSPPVDEVPEKAPPVAESPPLPTGRYDVQSVSYDDASGAYRLFVVGAPAGTPPAYTTTALRMARLTDEQLAAGEKMHLLVDAEGPVLWLGPEDKIEYTHNVVEDRGGEPVVVRQETSAWSPFMAGMTGAMIGNMLFSPSYYYPPPYSRGVMGGFGGSGRTLTDAQASYAQRHGAPPQASRLSKSGYSKMPSASSLRSTGSGAGGSRLKSAPTTSRPKPSGGFGGFGGRRRR